MSLIPHSKPQFPQCFNCDRKFERPDPDKKQSKLNEKYLSNFYAYLDKINKFAHTQLYCRDPNQMLTASELKILNSQRNKYISYINKNFKYKIPEEFSSKKIMKERKEQLFRKLNEQSLKKQFQNELKPKKRVRQTKSLEKQPLAKPTKKKPLLQLQSLQEVKQTKKAKAQQKKQKNAIQQSKKQQQIDDNMIEQEQQLDKIQQDENFLSQQDLANRDLDQLPDDD